MFKAAYNEGRSSVDKQYSALNATRTRSVQFMAFVGSATAFLVGSAVSGTVQRSVGFYLVLILATLISVAALVFLILILLSIVRKPVLDGVEDVDRDADPSVEKPEVKRGGRGPEVDHRARRKWGRAEWNFLVAPKVLVNDWISPSINPSTEADFYRDLALHSQKQLDDNDDYMIQVDRWYHIFVILATIQIVAWVIVAWMFA